jgi:hypothetical protein
VAPVTKIVLLIFVVCSKAALLLEHCSSVCEGCCVRFLKKESDDSYLIDSMIRKKHVLRAQAQQP